MDVYTLDGSYDSLLRTGGRADEIWRDMETQKGNSGSDNEDVDTVVLLHVKIPPRA